MRGICLALVLGLALGAVRSAHAGEPDAAGIEFFEKKIRPVLVEHCYECHSVAARDAGHLKGGLLLDGRDGLLKGGESGPAIEQRNAETSLLISALRHESLKMPPNRKLPDQVIKDFATWIAIGSPDPRETTTTTKPSHSEGQNPGREFWSFQPLKPSPVPNVRQTAWLRNPIDAFILQRLEETRIAPHNAADRRTLIRRLSFDVCGLPPDPVEVEAFVTDPAPDAYERLVDRVLDRPEYGERWARHWLDLARFMESNGNAHDDDRKGAYHFRDFVIDAFNRDLPYDEFVRLQLAGDILNPNDLMARAATGFLAAGPVLTEQTVKERERSRYDQLDDVLSTVGTGMLGLTVGCARCHDHKYDPVSSEEYYRMLACFATTGFQSSQFQLDSAQYLAATKNFSKVHQPFVDKRVQYERDQIPARLAVWERSRKPAESPQWVVMIPTYMQSIERASFRVLLDGSVLVDGINSVPDDYTVLAETDLKGILAVRLEVIPDPTLPHGAAGRAADGSFELTDLRLAISPKSDIGDQRDVIFHGARASLPEDSAGAAKGTDNNVAMSWIVNSNLDKTHSIAAATDTGIGFDGGTQLRFNLIFHGAPQKAIGRFRLSILAPANTTAPQPAFDSIAVDANSAPWIVMSALQRKPADRSADAASALTRWFGQSDPEWCRLYTEEELHFFERPRAKLTSVYCASINGTTYYYPDRYNAYFLVRGEPGQKKGLASPGFIHVLMSNPEQPERWTADPAKPAAKPRPSRLAFAAWITDVDHGAGSLLARVIVNRLWQHHMGRGIVASTCNFGVRGERPSHPELLDYLASELIRGGWRLKPIHKLMLTSSTYMQSGLVSAAGRQSDPENRLLWRHTPAQLEAEIIRDGMLAASGCLDREMTGLGSLDEHGRRRSIYFTVKHSQPVPMMELFNAPYSTNSIGERPVSIGPAQALALINSSVVRELAEAFARHLQTKSATDMPQLVDCAYQIAFSRSPSRIENEQMCKLIESLSESYGNSSDASDRAIVDFCQLIFCSNEFVIVD